MLTVIISPIHPFIKMIMIISIFLFLSACGPSKPTLPQGSVIELSDAFTGAYELTDQNGETRSQNNFVGKPTLVYFGFTSCPDVCPAALGIMTAALNEWNPTSEDLQPLFIALDAERDTPEALKDYLAFDQRILGLTGSQEEIDSAKQAFKVYAQRQPLPDSALGYTINHTSFFYFVDKTGKPRFALKDTVSPQQLAQFVRYHSQK